MVCGQLEVDDVQLVVLEEDDVQLDCGLRICLSQNLIFDMKANMMAQQIFPA